MSDQNPKDVYWFSNPDPKAVADKLYPTREGMAVTKSSAIKQVWQRNLASYYSAMVEPSSYDSSLNFGGAEGELVEMVVPMARSVTRQVVTIVTKQKLAFNVLADNTEAGTIKDARLGTTLCKSIIQNQSLDVSYERFVENNLVTGMAVFAWRWRTDLGEYFTQDLFGTTHYTGDIEVTVPNIWEVEFDARIHDPKDWYWVQIPYMHNRWDLIAQFPHLADELKKVPSIDKSANNYLKSYEDNAASEDLIYVYCAYHKPTASMPEGRMIAYASPSCILLDGKNIYGRLPISVSRPEPLPNSSYGYPYLCNLLPAQEMLDNTISSIATNNSAFGVQAVKAARKSNVSPEQIWGMNFFFYDKVTEGDMGPEPINFTQSAPESWKFIDVLKSFILDLSMINSALRGDPPTGVTSGTAIATLTTTALESVASASKSARAALRELMLGCIDTYRRMASVERELSIPGITNQMENKKFTGADLDGIKDVQVVEMNPLMQTQMGRESQAEKLLQFGLITNVKGYFSIVEGAPPSEMYQNELSQEDLVKRENEAMINGEPVVVVNIDDHPYHIMMHSMLLNDNRVRLNSSLNQQVLAHIATHYQQETDIDPGFAAMVRTGKTPQMPMGMPQQALPPAGGGAPPPEAAPGGRDEGKKAKPANPTPDPLGRQGEVA